ncbi:MAG: YihY/virulence factor BrkB family protein [Saprospiraceae bacterium]
MRKKLPTWEAFQKSFAGLPPVATLLQWSKTHSLPGFFKVPFYDVAVFLYNESRRVTIISRANSMAFSFFLSLFPAIIFLFTVATMLPLYHSFEHEINSYIDYIMPTNAGIQLKLAIKNLVKPDKRLLSVGFILTLHFSSNGMLAMMSGFEKTHLKAFRKRPAWRKRLIAIALTLQMGLLLMVSVVLIILGNFAITWLAGSLHLPQYVGTLMHLFRWMVILALFYFGIAMIYRYGAALHRPLKWLTPGTTLATILSILSSLVFSFYVEAFDTYNKIYGSIGTIMVLMLWIEINCFILLVGFELNASIAVNRDLKLAQEEED